MMVGRNGGHGGHSSLGGALPAVVITSSSGESLNILVSMIIHGRKKKIRTNGPNNARRVVWARFHQRRHS